MILTTSRAWPIAFAALAAACTPSLTSPPSHLHELASPAIVGAETTSVTASVSGGGEVFGPGVVAAEVQVRHGVGERAEIGGSVSAAVLPGGPIADPPHRGIYAARFFARRVLVPRILTFSAGLGGGGSAGGGYLSPDLGLNLGYENPYVVPYAFGSFLFSQPLTYHTIDVRMQDETTPDLRRPFRSFGTEFGVGLRIPVGPRSLPVGSLFVELSALALYGDDPYDSSSGISNLRGIVTGGVAYTHYFRRGKR